MSARAARVSVSVAVALIASSVRADRAGDAEHLFEEGKALMASGSYPAACSKLAASLRLDSGIGTMLWLALCFERNGQMASAWEQYREAAAAAAKLGDEREKVARASAAGVEPKVSKLTIVVPHPAPGLEVERDGMAVAASLWGAAVPVDAGQHTIVAKAPHRVPWQALVDLGPDGAAASVSVPALAEPSATPTATASTAQRATSNDSAGRGRTQRIVGLGVGGLGLVATGFGAYFGLHAKSLNDEATPNCPARGCNDAGFEARTDAKTAARASTILFVGGAVALAAGIVVFVTAPSSRPALTVMPTAAASSGGLDVRAAF